MKTAKVNQLIEELNKLEPLVEDVVREADANQIVWDNKSEQWQDSDVGEEWQDKIDAVDDFAAVMEDFLCTWDAD